MATTVNSRGDNSPFPPPGQPASIGATSGGDAPVAASIAALITEVPVRTDPVEDVRRDDGARVPRARQERAVHLDRAVMQPLLFAFVFADVLPKIGSGFLAGAAAGAGGGVNFTTILGPGLDGLHVPHAGHVARRCPGHGVLLAAHHRGPRPGPRPDRRPRHPEDHRGRDPGDHRLGDRLPGRVPGARPRSRARTSTCRSASSFPGHGGRFGAHRVAGPLAWPGRPAQDQMVFADILLPLTMLGGVDYPWAARTLSAGGRSSSWSTRWTP